MKPFRHLLVDVDALSAEHPALVQALDLAERCRARVKIVDVLPDVPRRARRFVTRAVEQELVQDREARLHAIAHGHTQGAKRTVAVLRGRPAEVLVDEVVRGGHDLLVRAHQRDLSTEPKPFGPIDMHLLRTCPCPVWLVGAKPIERRMRIVACLDVSAPDADHQALNRKVIDLALMMRDVHDGTLTLLHGWAPFGESLLRPRLSKQEFAEFVASTHDEAAVALDALLAPLGRKSRGITVELLKGEPEDVIPAFAKRHRADLIVMGTVARTGVAGALVGNTAERVLVRLRGSVLAIKPSGFAPPLRAARTAAASRPRTR